MYYFLSRSLNFNPYINFFITKYLDSIISIHQFILIKFMLYCFKVKNYHFLDLITLLNIIDLDYFF